MYTLQNAWVMGKPCLPTTPNHSALGRMDALSLLGRYKSDLCWVLVRGGEDLYCGPYTPAILVKDVSIEDVTTYHWDRGEFVDSEYDLTSRLPIENVTHWMYLPTKGD